MSTIEARIEWRVYNNNDEETSSSYEDISSIEDAQDWIDRMENLLEED